MNSSPRYWTALTAVALLCACRPAGAADTPANRSIKLPVVVTGLSANKARLALEKAYAAIGIEVKFVNMPGELALIESTHGSMDGEIVRTVLIEKDYPQLLRVPVPLYFFSVSTIVRNEPGATAPTLEAARNSARVGVVRGIKATETLVSGWPNLTLANNLESGMKMLQAKRFDVLVTPTESAMAAMQSNNMAIDAFKIRTVMTIPTYHYLNRNNAALVPAIGAELSRLKGKRASVLEGISEKTGEEAAATAMPAAK